MVQTDIVVRVIDYAVDDPGRPQAEPRYRLITTILDPGTPRRASWPRSTRSAGSSRPRWMS